MMTEQETLLGRGTQAEAAGWWCPRRTRHVARSPRLMVVGLVSGLSLDSRLAWLIFNLTQGLS